MLPAALHGAEPSGDAPAAERGAIVPEEGGGDAREDARDAAVQPPARPTEVRVGVTVLAIGHVSAPNEPFQRFTATLALTTRWTDPRLAFEPSGAEGDRRVFVGAEARRRLAEIWSPDLVIENEEGERSIDARSLVIRSNGIVTYDETFDAQFQADFDLRAFPFDAQTLPIVIQSGAFNARSVVLLPIEARMRVEAERVGEDWRVGGLSYEIRDSTEARSSHPFSELRAGAEVRRIPGFYLGKVLLPLLVIVAFTWTTFWMTGEAAGTRMQRTFIALLSIVAFTQVIAGHLPRISYVTFLDAVMYAAFLSTGLTLIQIILTHRAAEAGDVARWRRIDGVARVAFPLGFTVAVLASYLALAR